MKSEKVISREYKLVLKAEKFAGDEQDLIKKTQKFWVNFQNVATSVIKKTSGNLNILQQKREIRFYDTKDFTLHSDDYIFRERKNLLTDKREITLKFRHPDRYVSQDRDMEQKKEEKQEIKFEEDIKAPFNKLYSFSSSRPINDDTEFKKLKHVFDIYPSLAHQLNNHRENEEIFLVNDLAIQELVITGAEFHLGKDPSQIAECALIIWYRSEVFETAPIIVEFSFRYGNKKEKYSREIAQKSYTLFLLIQEKMGSWIDNEAGTKTSFLYENR